MSNYEEIFNQTIAGADALGYEPDITVLTKGILALLTDSVNDRVKAQKLLSFISNKQSSDPKFEQHYQELKKKVRDYLVWAVPYLFYDDADDTIIKRDPQQEKEIVNAAQKLLQEIEQ